MERGLAERLAAGSFRWYHRFELAPGIVSPGYHDVANVIAELELPDRLDGRSALDIGTANGGVVLEAERRGAAPCVATDVVDGTWFGFDEIAAAFDSKARFVTAGVYELPEVVEERFDVVFFLGVLYHLRNPLMGLDAVREMARVGSVVYVETAVADGDHPELAGTPSARFHRADELGKDASNWFVPSIACLGEWCASAGFEVEWCKSWPGEAPTRALMKTVVTEETPEFARISPERRLRTAPETGERLRQGWMEYYERVADIRPEDMTAGVADFEPEPSP